MTSISLDLDVLLPLLEPRRMQCMCVCARVCTCSCVCVSVSLCLCRHMQDVWVCTHAHVHVCTCGCVCVPSQCQIRKLKGEHGKFENLERQTRCVYPEIRGVCGGLFVYLSILFNSTPEPPHEEDEVLQCVATVRCSMRSVLQCSAVCCSTLQCAAAHCSTLQLAAVYCIVLQCTLVCCSVLRYDTAYCSVLQCAAVYCSVPQCHSDENQYQWLWGGYD